MVLFFCFIFAIIVIILTIIFAFIDASDKQRKIDRDSGYGLGPRDNPSKLKSPLDEDCIEFANIIYKNSKLGLAEATKSAQAICIYLKEKKEQSCKTSKHI
jgi:hypothetical protein